MPSPLERRGVLGDVDVRVVDADRPVEHAWYLPARIAWDRRCSC